MARTGDRSYVDELDSSFETNKGPFPAGERSTDEIYGNFTSRAIDDAGWWALNWVGAYDLTGDQKYLDMAATIGEFMHGFWDTSTCGGGIWWNEERTYKNAVTNGQWVRLTAELHNRIPGDTVWLDRSQDGLGLVRGQRHDQRPGPGQRRAAGRLHQQQRHRVDLQPGPGDRRPAGAVAGDRRRRRCWPRHSGWPTRRSRPTLWSRTAC